MSRRSPRSYISRTFPDAMRGRSETGGMGRRLLRAPDFMVPPRKMRGALRDTWRVLFWSRALVWAVGIVAALRFGFDPTISGPPPEARPYGWTASLLTVPSTPWDAGHYLAIATHGYDQPLRAAFFPLYPLLSRAITLPLES